MHSIHPMQTHSDHQETSIQQQQQQQQPTTIDAQQHQMTVLETLNPSGEQQQQQAPTYQQAEEQIFLENQQPHLHQLETSHGNSQIAEQQQQLGGSNSELRQTVVESSTGSSMVPVNGPILQWLLDKYEIAEGESLPRSLVYNHYLSHCRSLRMASVNAASFGKMIRSVFLGLKTRRLGTRGHSKYHYFGIRAKQHTQQELLQQHGESGSGAVLVQGCSSSNLMSNDSSNQNLTDGNGSDETGSPANNDTCNGRLSSNSSSINKRVRRSSQQQHHHQQEAAYPNQMIQDQQLTHHQQQQQDHSQQFIGSGTTSNGLVYYSNNGYSATNGYLDKSSSQQHVQQQQQHQQQHYDLTDFRNHLGANWITLVDEHWPAAPVAEQSSSGPMLTMFELRYKLFYKRMIELLSELKFLEVEQLWQEFWRPAGAGEEDKSNGRWSPMHSQVVDQQQQQQPQQQQQQQQQQMVGTVGSPSMQSQPSDMLYQINYNQHLEQQELTFHQLYQLTGHAKVVERINQIDYILYEAIESFLLPDKLSPIPRFLYQQIKLFAKNFPFWIELAVKDYNLNFVHEKTKSARAFGSALVQSTKLNHLSTASRAIWEKRSSLAQMSIDLSRVDLRDIEHQIYLMNSSSNSSGSGSSSGLHKSSPSSSLNLFSTGPPSAPNDENANNENNVNTSNSNTNHQNGQQQHLCAIQPAQLIQSFLHLLEDPYPANSWPGWCRNLVESGVCGLSLDSIREEAANFVLKYNFCISLITKELTLKSAPSFGSFHLIRLLFDEYISCLLVNRLAQVQKMTPAQLLSSQ